MPNENDQPIGGPEPMDKGKGIDVWSIANVIAIASIGFVLFGTILKPRRCAGATRSARLRWQAHQAEVEKAKTVVDATERPEKAEVSPEKTAQPESQ